MTSSAGSPGTRRRGWRRSRRRGDIEAPTKEVDGQNAGRVYVYSTKSGRRLLGPPTAGPATSWETVSKRRATRESRRRPDVIAGAPGGGYARVYSGRDGRVLLTLRAEDANDQFGQHADGVGDVNGDGFADLMVGAPGNNAGASGPTRVRVFVEDWGRASPSPANGRGWFRVGSGGLFRREAPSCSWAPQAGPARRAGVRLSGPPRETRRCHRLGRNRRRARRHVPVGAG